MTILNAIHTYIHTYTHAHYMDNNNKHRILSGGSVETCSLLCICQLRSGVGLKTDIGLNFWACMTNKLYNPTLFHPHYLAANGTRPLLSNAKGCAWYCVLNQSCFASQLRDQSQQVACMQIHSWAFTSTICFE